MVFQNKTHKQNEQRAVLYHVKVVYLALKNMNQKIKDYSYEEV